MRIAKRKITEVPPEACFSWNDNSDQLYPIVPGSFSEAISSTMSMACPELNPGAGFPMILIDGYRLNRVTVAGP